jgi:hypothetical protein
VVGDALTSEAMMAKVYVYKMIVDSGGAPCVKNGILSLAICKPAIRSTARRGNIVLGFAATSLYSDNRLVYMAKVTKRLDGRRYFSNSKYNERPDCIYDWDGRHFAWEASAKYHSQDDLEHDLGKSPNYKRAGVLLSKGTEKFRYFRGSCPVRYKRDYPRIKRLVEKLKRGHRVNHGRELRQELTRFIKELWRMPSAFQETPVPKTWCSDKCGGDRERLAIVEY